MLVLIQEIRLIVEEIRVPLKVEAALTLTSGFLAWSPHAEVSFLRPGLGRYLF
jgi:hypothetical protein